MKKAIRFMRIVIGLLITTMAYTLLLNPYDISVGGMTGLSLVINRYLNLPVTAILVVLNTALFAYGIKRCGIPFTVRSILAMLSLGLLLDAIPQLQKPLMDRTLSMILGSILSGVGYGFIVAAETSTGGSDQLAFIVTSISPKLSVGLVMNAFDAFVVIIDSITTGNWLFSSIAVILCNSMIDIVDCMLNHKGLPEWTIEPRCIYKRYRKLIWIMFILLVITIFLRRLLMVL